MELNIYELWLSFIPALNGSQGQKLIDYLGSAEEVYKASENLLKNLLTPGALRTWKKSRAELDPYELPEKLQKAETDFIFIDDDSYPQKLTEIPDAPLGIFIKGKLPENNLPKVSIIGARECSDYGIHIARELGDYLGRMGITVISGMARGIDGIAQSAALDAGGSSVAVLGSGPDVCYPLSNRSLYEKLLSSGAVLSTYPPGTKAIAANFPPRNRIVSGLSDAVVVIEARQKSGTLITVDMALEQGREVYAVPGRITDRLSDGCNGLIGQGANIFLSPEIFLSELTGDHNLKTAFGNQKPENEEYSGKEKNLSTAEKLIKTEKQSIPEDLNNIRKMQKRRCFEGRQVAPVGLTSEQLEIYELLDLSPKSVDELLYRLPAEYSYLQVTMILMQLTVAGCAKQVSQDGYIRIL